MRPLASPTVSRRGFLRRAAALAVLPALDACCELTDTCPSPVDPVTGRYQTVSVAMEPLAQAIQPQQCELWCWAASISMIFAYHGYTVPQAQIVQQTYGAVVCLPSGNTFTIGSDLSRPWIDTRGRRFQSRVTAAFDPLNGIANLSNAQIIDELRGNRPLLYCNRTHAEVLYKATYSSDYADISDAWVVDPWPPNQRLHPLTFAERIPLPRGGDFTFLAAVSVTPS